MRTARLLTVWGVRCQGVGVEWEVCVVNGGCANGITGSDIMTPPPPVNRMTDTCKNITFSQLRFRAVTRMHSSRMHTARSSTVTVGRGEVSVSDPPERDPPLDRDPSGQRIPWTEDPLDREPPWTKTQLWKYYLAPNFVCGRQCSTQIKSICG